MEKIYLDNAATTFPKPPCVVDAMVDFMRNYGCNPGRGGYELSIQSGRIVYKTRCLLNELFNGPAPENVIFTQNITASLNTVIKGMFKNGWHIITTTMEHNSIMRPLRTFEKSGLKITSVQCNCDGTLNPYNIREAIKKDTKAIIMTHASNIIGTIMPIEEIGKICREFGLYFILDTAQTAGIVDIDFKKMNIDVLAFTGHKGLLGPQGTGGFIISDKATKIMHPLVEGGTGSSSHLEIQPNILPDKYESGTLNTVGISGLKASVEFIKEQGINKIRNHEKNLLDKFIYGLTQIQNINFYGTKDSKKQTATISLNIKKADPSEISYILDSHYGIMVRSGLHCTPSSHKTIGTYPLGTIRFSIGYFNTEREIEYSLNALKEIALENI